MKDIGESLTKWFLERPQWLQIAASRVIKRSELTYEDISELATLCKQEVNGKLAKTVFSFPASAFSLGTAGELRLCSISDVEGVNALAPKTPLKFGKDNITIVYGKNGSGKSGYIRLLKQICGARGIGTLYGNVFDPQVVLQKANIAYVHNDIQKNFAWSGQEICDKFSNIDIFDTSFNKVFVSSEDEVTYEPPIFSFFNLLIITCDKIASTLDAELNQNPSKKPNIPPDKKKTPEGIWYESISVETAARDINKHCAFSSSDNVNIQTMQQRLAEKEPAEKAKQLRNQKQHVNTLVKDAQRQLEQLSDENCQRIMVAKSNYVLKKKAADIAAKNLFSGNELKGIGSDVWKELWEAARKYSVTVAYQETSYPNVSDGSRCVLCQQILSQKAKDRLVSFESFVKDKMQKAANDAKNEYFSTCQTIEELPTSKNLKTKLDAAGITQIELISQVTRFYTQLKSKREQILEMNSEKAIEESPLSSEWIEEAIAFSKRLGELEQKYDEDAKKDNREEIKVKLSRLQTRKWLSEQRTAIAEEIKRLKLLNEIEKARKLVNTKALSQKKGELAEHLITEALVQRFNAELRSLGASKIKVELVKSKVSKGRVLHKIQLRGASQSGLTDVLSEGEKRIVSIAAFMADVASKSNQTPIIFDDPISSLDQNYEETVVQRLIELSCDKQIIVFTHRLSLLGTFRYFSEKKDIKLQVISIRSADWGTGEPAPIPLSQCEIKTALNTLMYQRCQDARKASENNKPEQAEILLKSICSDFRTLIERSVENDLICGVIQRFQRPVHTIKLKHLAKLKDEDCKFLDSLMTKYSRFEHSQPAESPIDLPKPDELLGDMTLLKNWREEYTKRSASAVAK